MSGSQLGNVGSNPARDVILFIKEYDIKMKFDMKKFEVPFANIFTSSNTDIRDIGGGIFKNTDKKKGV